MEVHLQTPPPSPPGPTMGNTVDEVLGKFIDQADAWCGVFIVEALLPISNAGRAIKFRVQSGSNTHPYRPRIGVSLHDGLCIRDATDSEQDELEAGVANGEVQIYKFRTRSMVREILHEAHGRPIPRSADC